MRCGPRAAAKVTRYGPPEAALAVYQREPLESSEPLTTFRDVTLTPHFGAFTLGAVRRMVEGISRNLIDVAAVRRVLGGVNSAELQSHA